MFLYIHLSLHSSVPKLPLQNQASSVQPITRVWTPYEAFPAHLVSVQVRKVPAAGASLSCTKHTNMHACTHANANAHARVSTRSLARARAFTHAYRPTHTLSHSPTPSETHTRNVCHIHNHMHAFPSAVLSKLKKILGCMLVAQGVLSKSPSDCSALYQSSTDSDLFRIEISRISTVLWVCMHTHF
jgi:hypothetical protein